MAGTIAQRELTSTREGSVRFAVATRADDAEIRRLLREHPMPGRIAISLEREPDYFADAFLPGEVKQTIVARHDGRIECAGSCTIRQRFVNGAACRVGYLGGLRLDARHAGRFGIVRRGYELFRQLQADKPADFYFTSIAADNTRARRFLEQGVPGMPRYEFIGDFVTVLLPARQRKRAMSDKAGWHVGASANFASVAELLNAENWQRQFAPHWSPQQLEALEGLGLCATDFHAVNRGDQPLALAALWDQRGCKQTVIRGYTPWLALARPGFNVIARLLGEPRLPAPGQTLANALVSHLLADPEDQNAFVTLLADLQQVATERGIELLTLGFAANDPRLRVVRAHFRCRAYQSRLYVVTWPGIGQPAAELDDRVLAPEVALL